MQQQQQQPQIYETSFWHQARDQVCASIAAYLMCLPTDQVLVNPVLSFLFQNHPNYESKAQGRAVSHFVRTTWRKLPYYKVVFVDGTYIDYNPLKAAQHVQRTANASRQRDRKPDHYYNVTKAFRHEISDFVLGFRYASGYANDPAYHVDHVIPFKTLLEDFLEAAGLTAEEVEIKDNAPFPGYRLADPILAQEWAEYHRNHAELAMLPAQANRVKGAKPAPAEQKVCELL